MSWGEACLFRCLWLYRLLWFRGLFQHLLMCILEKKNSTSGLLRLFIITNAYSEYTGKKIICNIVQIYLIME